MNKDDENKGIRGNNKVRAGTNETIAVQFLMESPSGEVSSVSMLMKVRQRIWRHGGMR